MNTRTAALIIGIIFIAVGLLAFVDNPIITGSESAIFHADKVHSAVHLASGALFILIALAMPGSAGGFCKLFGIVYLIIGIIGFIKVGSHGMGKILGFLHVNGADNYLHVALGIVIYLAGTLRGPRLSGNS